MPICKRDGFDAPLKNNYDTFRDDEEVFYCEVTKEIFRDYEDYFRHIMIINSTVWQCEATGREHMTYAEALKSERRARKKMELFKDSLRPPVMLVIEHAKQSSLKSLDTIINKFLRSRYFLNEEVSACVHTTTYSTYTVIEVIPPDKTPPVNGVFTDTEELQYKLRSTNHVQKNIVVPYANIRRHRGDISTETLHMFIKSNVIRVDGILLPKPESYKKYVVDRNITFASIFIGKMPHFSPATIKRPSANGKKQATINKYLVKNEDETSKASKSNTEQNAEKRKKTPQDPEAKAKFLKEEMERIRREKQEKLLALEREKVEKRNKLMARIEEECNVLLLKTEDLERKDQRLLPTFVPIDTLISNKLLGETFMLHEFIQSFSNMLSGIEVFRGNLSIYEIARAFTVREVGGPLSDILLVIMGTIFDLLKEEEEECAVKYTNVRDDLRKKEPFTTMMKTVWAHRYVKRHFSFKINELPIDPWTVSEVIRLHLLSSGAVVDERTEKWRIMYRNGYSSTEDPGLIFRQQQPHILRALKMYSIYQLPFMDIMRILHCLISQILTYSSTINLIEERMETCAKARADLRTLALNENRRLATVQSQKRALNIEYNQRCMDDDVKNDVEKKAALKDKLDKKIADVVAHSEREHRKFEQQVQNLNTALFNFMVCLGMDRAYRKYYVLESIAGIFVEHPADCGDTCLPNPPVNDTNSLPINAADLPKNRRDLRAYLLKKYLHEEKKAKTQSKIKGKESQENKENENNPLLNGLTNGHDPAIANGVEKIVDGETPPLSSPEAPPTQYQLYMCTGDPRNCIVHDGRNKDRHHWSYLYKEEDIDALIESLNPKGERESQLREQLIMLRSLILRHVKNCPVEMLSIEDESQRRKVESLMITETYRRYNKSNFGFKHGTDVNEVMCAALIDRILLFEREIYTGDLGVLKVKDMEKWRNDVANNEYDPQANLNWGCKQHKITNTTVDDDDMLVDEDDDDMEAEMNDGGQFANVRFRDPGEELGDTLQIDSEDSEDDSTSLHDSSTLRTSVTNLASALLQVEQAIQRRFIKEPFGINTTLKETSKDKEILERKQRAGVNRLKQWEVSLMESTSYAHIFLHLNILHDSILWSRSTNKSICQVCRRGSDPEKMLLCDECNGGTHMFCMKPKLRTVPAGNWYCNRCVKRLGLTNRKSDTTTTRTRQRKRAFIIEADGNASDVSSDSAPLVPRGSRREGSGRQSNKKMHSSEIAEVLEEEDDEIESPEEADENNTESNEDDVSNDDEDGDDSDENKSDIEVQSETESEQDEDDENVCIVCSYNGSELVCTRCKDTYHLECINLKRPPRYNFICTKCKGKEDRKRKVQANDDSDDDDDDDDDSDRRLKRSRHQRASLRHSLANGNANQEAIKNNNNNSNHNNNNSRRSNRRTGDNMPLNSSALYKLLEDVIRHEQAWPFLRPVMQSEVPDYYKIISNPMNLAKVKSKLNMGEYQLNEEVMKDIQLIFSNCDRYNVKGNEIYEAGCALEKFVIDRCKDLSLPFQPSDMNAED